MRNSSSSDSSAEAERKKQIEKLQQEFDAFRHQAAKEKADFEAANRQAAKEKAELEEKIRKLELQGELVCVRIVCCVV